MYFEALLGPYKFRIIMSSWLGGLFIPGSIPCYEIFLSVVNIAILTFFD